MGRFRALLAIVALLWGPLAFAGPKVGKSLINDLPGEVQGRFDAGEKEIKELEGKLKEAEADKALATTKERAAVAAARVSFLQAEIDYKKAELESQKAQAVADNGGDIDPNVFASAASKAQIKYEQARADLKIAESKLYAAGGAAEDVPGAGEEAPK
jgi:hypothetical protein